MNWLEAGKGHRTFITTAFIMLMSAVFTAIGKLSGGQWIEASSIVLAIYGTKSVAETVAVRRADSNA